MDPGTQEDAFANVEAFVRALGLDGIVVATHSKIRPEEGRFLFVLTRGARWLDVEMPGPSDRTVFVTSDDQDAFAFPAVHVNGSPLPWPRAVEAARSALT